MLRRKTESFGRGTSPARVAGTPPPEINPYLRDGETERADVRAPLTKKQRSFVRDCVETQRPLAEVMDDHNVTPDRFAAWMTKRAFRQHLEKMSRSLSKAREFDIAVGARRAAELMNRNTNPDGDPPLKHPQQIRAGAQLIRFARSSEARRKAQTVEKRDALNRSLVHPDVSLEETQRLLKLMDEAANS